MHSISISIAGIAMDMCSCLSAAELGIEKRLGPFFCSKENPAVRSLLQWEESAGIPQPRGELIYDPGSIWRMFRTGTDYCAEISYPNNCIKEPNAQGVLCTTASWDQLTLSEQRTGADWQSLLNIGAGELILRTRIIFADGLVFHAAGVDDNGRGIVFVGHSGAGKSTQAGLWSEITGAIAMNDDRIAVRVEAGRATCYGTPWGGDKDIARNHKAPLAAIVLLEQSTENNIQPLSPSLAASLLLARTFLPYWNYDLMQHAFANLNAILAIVPVYRLCCRPEPTVIPLVRSIL